VVAVHSTNGKWDLIADIQADSLEEFDKAINEIREMKEISSSETNLLLSTYAF
jgi:DNA-binding Lrp family transcriptional regulator